MLTLVTPATDEPLSVDEVKRHLRVDLADEDQLIAELIVSARQLLEEETGRQFGLATWRYTLDDFPRYSAVSIELPRPPLVSVTSVTYLDSAGATQTWASSNYTVVAPSGPYARPGTIFPNYDKLYPNAFRMSGAITITYIAGYATVPEAIRHALLVLISDMYVRREASIEGSSINANPVLSMMVNRLRGPVMA